jgi:hypothetical protein
LQFQVSPGKKFERPHLNRKKKKIWMGWHILVILDTGGKSLEFNLSTAQKGGRERERASERASERETETETERETETQRQRQRDP